MSPRDLQHQPMTQIFDDALAEAMAASAEPIPEAMTTQIQDVSPLKKIIADRLPYRATVAAATLLTGEIPRRMQPIYAANRSQIAVLKRRYFWRRYRWVIFQWIVFGVLLWLGMLAWEHRAEILSELQAWSVQLIDWMKSLGKQGTPGGRKP